MKPVFLRKVLAFFLLFGVFAFSAFPAFAQDESQTEERTFAEFHNETISLHGSADIQPVKFNLPADQQLIGDVEFQLHLTVFLPNIESLNGFDGTAGVLKLFVNGNSVGEFSLQESGDAIINLTIPSEKIPAHQTNEPLNLQLSLESYLPSQNDIEVRVRSTSTIRYSYETVLPNTDLIDFPRQFFQDSFQPDHALLVIPDQPTITELQSALTVAAGLGRLANNALSLDLVSVSQVTPEMQAENHLILVGKPEPFLALKGMIFPSPIVVRSDPEWTVQFLLPDRYEFERTARDDGLAH